MYANFIVHFIHLSEEFVDKLFIICRLHSFHVSVSTYVLRYSLTTDSFSFFVKTNFIVAGMGVIQEVKKQILVALEKKTVS